MSSDAGFKFEIFNGKVIPSGENIINATNRATRYGDGLFETIKIFNQVPLYFVDHYSRLMHGMQILDLKPHSDFDEAFIKEMISLLLLKNDRQNARVRLMVYRTGGGYYKPAGNTYDWHLCCTGESNSEYYNSDKGLKLGVYNKAFKNTGILSNLKTLNGLIYIHAALEATKTNCDEMVISNHYNKISEAISSNIFIVKDEIIYTPPLSDGCIAGILRKKILQSGTDNFRIYEKSISVEDLDKADEIFLTNVVQGAQWVSEFNGNSNYRKATVEKINSLLNKNNS